MPAIVARAEAKVGSRGSDLLPSARGAVWPPVARNGDRLNSPALTPAGAVEMLVEHASGQGAAEARRAILHRIQQTYGNHYAGMVVAELRARESEKTGKSPTEPLEPERTQPPKALMAAPIAPGMTPAAAAATPAPATRAPAPTAPATPAIASAAPVAAAPAPAAKAEPAAPPSAAATKPTVSGEKPPVAAATAAPALPGVAPAAPSPPADKSEPEAASITTAPAAPAGATAPAAAATPASAEAQAAAAPKADDAAQSKAPDGKAAAAETAGAASSADAKGQGPMAGGQRAPASPEEDPAFQAVVGRAHTVAHQHGRHDPAKQKATQAQAAAPPPANDLQSKAAGAQVGKMAQQEPKPFDRAGFKAALLAKIAEISPKNLEEADDFKKENKAATVKGAVTSQVAAGKEASQGPIKQTSQEAPDTGAVEPKPVTPLPPTEPGAPPPDIGANAAAPKSKSEEEVSLQAGSRSLDSQMGSAGVTEKQLKKSNESAFQGALDAKSEAQTNAVQAPIAYRKEEKAVLKGAEAAAAKSAGVHTASMHAIRHGQFGKVVGDQGTTQNADREARNEVARHIQEIYDRTKRLAAIDQLDQQQLEDGEITREHAEKVALTACTFMMVARMVPLMSPNPSRLARKPIATGIALASAFSTKLTATPIAPRASLALSTKPRFSAFISSMRSLIAIKAVIETMQQHPVFKSITVVEGKDTWDYDYVASPGRTKTGEKKSQADIVLEIDKILPRPGFRPSTKEEVPITKGEDRRHIEAWQVLHERLKIALNGKTVREAAKIMTKLNYPPRRLTRPAVLEAAQDYLRDQFNNPENLWAGPSAENQEKGREFARAKKRADQALAELNEKEFEANLAILEALWRDEPSSDSPESGKKGFMNVTAMTIKRMRQKFREAQDAAKKGQKPKKDSDDDE